MEKKPGMDFTAQGEEQINRVLAAVPPKDKGMVERVVKAGGKVMFSPETHQYMQTILSEAGNMADKLGIGIVQLMMLLHQQTKGTIPFNAWTPAASILLVHAMEFVDKTDGGMTMDLYSEALKVMIFGLKKKVEEIIHQGNKQPEQQNLPQQPQPAQPPAGLISAQPQGV